MTRSQRGVALLLLLMVVFMLSMFTIEFAYGARANLKMTGNISAVTQAQFHARSGTKIALLAVNARKAFPAIQNALKLFGKAGGKNMQIWRQACEFVDIFCTGKANFFGMSLLDFSEEKAVGVDEGSCSCEVSAEDGRINLNAAASPTIAQMAGALKNSSPRAGKTQANTLRGRRSPVITQQRGRNNLGFQLYGMFRPMIDTGHFNSEDEVLDLVLNIMDWTDSDDSKTDVDQSGNFVESSGAESADYGQYGYDVKNAKMDTVGELQLVEGMTTDAYCRVQDKLTVFATDKIDVNDADLFVLKAVMCQAIEDPTEQFNTCWGYMPGQLEGPPIDQALLMLDTCRQLKKAAYSTPFVRFSQFQRFFQQFPGLTGNAPLNINWRLATGQLGTTSKMVRVVSEGTFKNTKRKITMVIDSNSGSIVHYDQH